MATFKSAKPTPASIPDGVYLAKVVSAQEGCSNAGNNMLVMKLQLPSGETLPCTLTFVPKAAVAISAFCDSCGLIRPEEGADVELTPADCLGRYLYITVVNDGGDVDSDPCPRVSRFLTREVALIKRPGLVKIQLREQTPRKLTIVNSQP
jgi:hypothetical protein